MKKLLIVFIICALAIFSTFMITKNKLNLGDVTESISILSSKIFGKTGIQYSDEFKINRLQMKNATYNFNKLNENQKIMYSAIACSVRDLNPIVNVDNYAPDDVNKISEDAKAVMIAFYSDHPEVFYLNMTYKLYSSKSLIYDRIKIELTYTVKSKNDLESKLQQIEKAMESYTNGLENKSNFEKELYIHDNVAKNVKYYSDTTVISDVPEQYHSIYGAFIEKQAVCDGFAKAMQILLDKVNIENIFITGVIDEVPHAWNMVNLDNKWYHLDLTADKYVKEENGTSKIIAHTYFNVTDDVILKSHAIDNKENNPIANSIDYSFYNKTNSYISFIQNFDYRVKEIVAAQSQNNSLEFASDVLDVPTKLLNVLYDINFNGYKDSGTSVKMKYYNELNTYIVEK
jgi:transglutaminase/protease-like cytokinesis protein 3